MSISSDEWEKGKAEGALITKILQLLSRKDKMWSISGIREELFSSMPKGERSQSEEILNIFRIVTELRDKGKIESKQIEMKDGSLEFFYKLKTD